MKPDVKNFLEKMLAGVIMGIGGILPGVSGGIMAVAMGLYRKMLDAVYYFFRAPWENFLFLLPLGIGGVIGLVGTSQILGILLDRFRTPIMYLFIGLVLGGVPSLYKEGVKADRFRPKYLVATAVGALMIYALAMVNPDEGGVDLALNPFTAGLCGGIIALGTVIPGISTSFLLIFLGIYDEMLGALNSFNIPLILCTGIGMALVALLLIRLVKKMFDRFPSYTYFGVMGFLATSVILIFPGLRTGWHILVDFALLAGGFFAAMAMEKMMEKA